MFASVITRNEALDIRKAIEIINKELADNYNSSLGFITFYYENLFMTHPNKRATDTLHSLLVESGWEVMDCYSDKFTAMCPKDYLKVKEQSV